MTPTALLRGLIFLGLGVLLWTGLDAISRAHPPRGWDLILLQRMDTVHTESVGTLVLGSSHAGAIDPEALDGRSLVLPFPWNDFADVDFQVRSLLPLLPDLERALITVSYFSFHWSNDAIDDDGLLDSRRTFHSISPGWGTVEGDLVSLARGKSYWIARPDHWLGVAQGIRGEGLDEDDLGSHLEEIRRDSALVAHAEERVPHTLNRQYEMMEANPSLPEENHARLLRIIRNLQEVGACVVLFTPPFHYHYNALYLEERSIDEMRRIVRRIAEETGVEWLDYSHHPMSHEAQWFSDSDHLNAIGNTRFTKMLLDDLTSC